MNKETMNKQEPISIPQILCEEAGEAEQDVVRLWMHMSDFKSNPLLFVLLQSAGLYDKYEELASDLLGLDHALIEFLRSNGWQQQQDMTWQKQKKVS